MLLLFVSEIANRSADNVSDASFLLVPHKEAVLSGYKQM
jgi:hypothetical protein